jgi:hypothetical protein
MGLSRHTSFIETTKANKNQQLGVGGLVPTQQKSTNINKHQKTSTESTKVSKSQQKSAKVSTSCAGL